MKLLFFVALASPIALFLFLAWRSQATRASARGLAVAPQERHLTLAIVYLLYGSIAVSCIGLLMPPYQASDEGAHFARADQVSLGIPLGYRSGNNSGGVIDRGVMAAFGLFYPIVLHEERKATSDSFQQALKVKWQDGKEFSDFANTAFYPPWFYTTSASAISAGKALDLSVVTTLYAARLLNGFVALGLGALAIAVAGTAAPWFFALLCLPMSLAQAASMSQDALLFPVAALGAAIVARSFRERDGNAYDFALMCLLLALLATGRVTYGTLALVPLVIPRTPLKARVCGAIVIGFSSLGWSWLASHFTLVQYGLSGADASGQVHYLLGHPAKIFDIAANTIHYQIGLYLESFVGRLGWLDVLLPPLYVELAWAVLVAAAYASIVTGIVTRARCYAGAIVAFALASSIVALFAALYISWTPVGNFIVDGIQGRYFIPLAFFAPALCPFGSQLAFGGQAKWLNWVIAVFPVCSTTVVTLSIVRRYYET